MDLQRLEQHRRILGILFIASNALTLLITLGVGFSFGAVSMLAASSEELEGMGVFLLVALFIGGCFLMLSVPGLAVGWGLLKRRPWSRIAALVLGLLALPNFPLGTALGVYAIWFFGQQGSQRVFE